MLKTNGLLNKLYQSHKRQIIAVTIALSTILGSSGCESNNKEDQKEVYLVDLTDKYEEEAVLYDSTDKTPITIETADKNKLLALVMNEKTIKDKFYNTIVINENGKMFSGIMNGKYLEDKAIDKVKVDGNVLDKTAKVFASGGLCLSDDYNNIEENSNNCDYVIPEDAYIATTADYKVFPNNKYHWKEAVYVDNNKLYSGYLASDYTYISSGNKKAELIGTKYKVDSTALQLRVDATTDSDILLTLPNGSDVVELPFCNRKMVDNKEWSYVAVYYQGDIMRGYVCSIDYSSSTPVHYLVNEDEYNANQLDSGNNEKLNNNATYNQNRYGKYKIIDVSEYNHDIEFSKVKSSSIDAVLIRMFDSYFMDYSNNTLESEDEMCVKYARECEENNIPYGFYIYSRATTQEMAKKEALKVLQLASKYKFKPTFPIYWDVEPQENEPLYDENNNKVNSVEFIAKNPKKVLDNFNAFADVLINNGYEAGIYSNDETLCRLDPEGINLLDYSVWNSKYYYTDTRCDFTNNNYVQKLDYKGNVAIYQFSETGKIDGIDGFVDCNYGKYDYSLKISQEGKNMYLSEEEVAKITSKTLDNKSASLQKNK